MLVGRQSRVSRSSPINCMPEESRELPTGKVVIRDLDDEGQLLVEHHMYGMLEIAIKMEFSAGVKTEEMYFVKKKLASRKRYEKARLDYPDMPPADDQVEDLCGDLLKDLRAEQRRHAKLATEHVPNPKAAEKIDALCESLMAAGMRADAAEWVQVTNHTLGEYTNEKSRSLVKKLVRLGAKHVYACEIDRDDDEENTGNLVVELPDDQMARRNVLREVDRLASLQGLRGDLDEGQKYAYVKLD